LLGLAEGEIACVTSNAGSVEVPVEVTDAIMPGVVSLPHGWGHDQPGTQLATAARTPGVSSNILTDEHALDVLSGNAVLNGIPVMVRALTAAHMQTDSPVSKGADQDGASLPVLG